MTGPRRRVESRKHLATAAQPARLSADHRTRLKAFARRKPDSAHRWRCWCALLAVLWVASSFGQAASGDAATPQLSGKVIGGSGKHTLHVALWGADGFLVHPLEEVQIAPGAATDFHFNVRPGSWALSAYEDVNENGKLDMGAFGPKEPSGWWRPFHAWRKPRFEDVAVDVKKDEAGIEIRVK